MSMKLLTGSKRKKISDSLGQCWLN